MIVHASQWRRNFKCLYGGFNSCVNLLLTQILSHIAQAELPTFKTNVDTGTKTTVAQPFCSHAWGGTDVGSLQDLFSNWETRTREHVVTEHGSFEGIFPRTQSVVCER